KACVAVAMIVLFCSCAAKEPPKRGDWEVTPVGRLRFHASFAEQNRLLLGSEGQDPVLWDTQQGKRVAVLRASKAGIETAAVSPDGSQFATADEVGYDHGQGGERFVRSTRVWDTATGKLIKAIDIDLSGEGARDTTDWSISWWDRGTLLLQLYCRENPA